MSHKLKTLLTPVPSDIDIAQAAEPLPISQIAAEAGLLPEELVPYGTHKAKVKLSVRDRLSDKPTANMYWSPPLRPPHWAKAKQQQPSASARRSART